MNLLQGDPLVIMLDELPPYFVNATAKTIGNSDRSVVTTTALSNLLVAVGRDELRNVCVVISDLKATYAAGGAQHRQRCRLARRCFSLLHGDTVPGVRLDGAAGRCAG